MKRRSCLPQWVGHPKGATYGGEVSQYNYKCKHCPMSYTGAEKPDIRFRLHEKMCKRTNKK